MEAAAKEATARGCDNAGGSVLDIVERATQRAGAALQLGKKAAPLTLTLMAWMVTQSITRRVAFASATRSAGAVRAAASLASDSGAQEM